MGPIHMIFVFIGALFRRQAGLAAENLALRQQRAVLEHESKRPRLRQRDRALQAILSRGWRGGAEVAVDHRRD